MTVYLGYVNLWKEMDVYLAGGFQIYLLLDIFASRLHVPAE